MAKKVGVILSGCGFQDGAEIHESVITLLALDRAGAEAVCLAPDMAQTKVTNHATGQVSTETRNVLAEAARISRGKIGDVAAARAAEFDALILPGGYGAALNLSDFAARGARATVQPDVARLIREVHAQGKPIGAWCIAPGPVAVLLAKEGIRVTIGDDPGTAKEIELAGARHESCAVDKIVVDADRKIVTTPAYMYDARISEVASGIDKAVEAVLKMA